MMQTELFTPLLTAGLFPARHLQASGAAVVSMQPLPGWAFLTATVCSILCIIALAWWIPFRMMRAQRTRVRLAERAAAEGARNAEIASMTRGLAHEIKNPLSTVVLNAQLLREEILDSPLDETERANMSRRVDTLAREAARLRDILTDFLRYAGRMQLDRRHCDLRDAVGEISDFFMPQAEQAGVRFIIDADRHPVIVDADPSLIKQALLNLLLNAVQAMQDLPEDRARTLHLSVVADQPDGRGGAPQCAAINVEDTGPGLTLQMSQHAFEPYHTTKPGGNGLGLATARRIVEAHGGSIEALQAVEGNGARFRITLPLASTRSDAKAAH
jgi:signal transduction histidine kinase